MSVFIALSASSVNGPLVRCGLNWTGQGSDIHCKDYGFTVYVVHSSVSSIWTHDNRRDAVIRWWITPCWWCDATSVRFILYVRGPIHLFLVVIMVKNVGPIGHNEPPHAKSPGVATVLSHAACASMSTTPTTTTTTKRDRGDRYRPHGMGPITGSLSHIRRN